MIMMMMMMKKITTICHTYKQCFGMLMSHLCPREFPQNVKFESLNVNQINFDMKISKVLFQKDFPLLNLYSIIYIPDKSTVPSELFRAITNFELGNER